MQKAMFERDVLYPTENPLEPGSAHITVYSPGGAGELPIVIRGKTEHNPSDYKLDIAGILQTDVFDRIRINIKEVGILFFVSINKNAPILKVKFISNDKYIAEEISEEDIL